MNMNTEKIHAEPPEYQVGMAASISVARDSAQHKPVLGPTAATGNADLGQAKS